MSIFKMRQWFRTGWIEKVIWGALIVVFLAGCFTLYGNYNTPQSAGSSTEAAAPAAIVNGQALPGAVFARVLDEQAENAKKSEMGYNIMVEEYLRAQVLQGLISKMALAQEAKRQGFEVTKGDVDAEIDKRAAADVQQERAKTGLSENDFENALRSNKSSVKALEDSFREKYDSSGWRPEIEWELYLTKLSGKIKGQSAVSDREFMRRYQWVTARRVVIPARGVSDVQARRRADEVAASARKGDDFSSLVAKFSDDPQYKAKGGLMEPMHVPLADAAMEDVLYNTKPGAIGGPTKVQNGYAIVKIEKVETKFPPDFEKKKGEERMSAEKAKFDRIATEIDMRVRRSIKVEKPDMVVSASQAYSQASGLPSKTPQEKATRQSAFQQVAKMYERILTNLDKVVVTRNLKAAVYTRLSQIYMMELTDSKGQPLYSKALIAANSARDEASDPVIYMLLADLYRKTGKPDKALEEYKSASGAAWGPQSIIVHRELKSIYTQMGRKDLVAEEDSLIKELYQQQEEAKQRRQEQQAAAAQRQGGAPRQAPTPGSQPQGSGQP